MYARSRSRKLYAGLRDTYLLFREFRWPLIIFCAAILGGGILYYYLSLRAGEPVSNVIAAIYQVLALTFLQPVGDFPTTWYLELYFFIMPLIGIGILAQGVADFGVLLFNRRARGKEWEMAVASTFNQHTILIGLGHLGYRVVRNLHQMEQDVVVVELNPSADLVAAVRQMGIPVLQDDGTRESALISAGIRRARSLILCTQNDSQNLQMAVKARTLNPQIKVIVRIFDDDFAAALQEQFGFLALSATGMAAPAFASAAAGVEVTRPISVEGRSLSLASLTVNPNHRLDGLTVGQIEKNYELSVVLLRHSGESDLHPLPGKQILAGDCLAVLGEPVVINQLIYHNTLKN